MHLSTLIATVVATTTASACTFSMISEQNNDSAGGGSFGCSLSIQPENRDGPIGPPYNGLNKDVGCGQGCDTVKYRGRTWKFCHSGLSPWGNELHNPRITIEETDNDGNVLLISPRDGQARHGAGESAFASWERNIWWRNKIHC